MHIDHSHSERNRAIIVQKRISSIRCYSSVPNCRYRSISLIESTILWWTNCLNSLKLCYFPNYFHPNPNASLSFLRLRHIRFVFLLPNGKFVYILRALAHHFRNLWWITLITTILPRKKEQKRKHELYTLTLHVDFIASQCVQGGDGLMFLTTGKMKKKVLQLWWWSLRRGTRGKCCRISSTLVHEQQTQMKRNTAENELLQLKLK